MLATKPASYEGILRLIAPELAGKILLLLAPNFKLERAQNIVDADAVLRRGSDGGRGCGASATKRQATTRAQRRRLLACRHNDRGAGGAGDGGVSHSGDGGDRGVHRQSSRLAFRRTSSVSDFKYGAFAGALVSEFFAGAF